MKAHDSLSIKLFVATLVALILFGCASATQIMQGYVGQPLLRVVEDYGLPVAAFETEPGSRAFIWQIKKQAVTPQIAMGQGSANSTLTGNNLNTQLFGNSIVFPATVSESSCNYTIYAKRVRTDIVGPGAWVVTGFKTPKFMCN